MHPIDQDGLTQLTEDLLAIGVHLDEPREPIEVGILEPTEGLKPRDPRVRRSSQWNRVSGLAPTRQNDGGIFWWNILR